MTVGGAVLLAVLVEQLRAVVRPDAIAQVVKQFDDGERLLWRPIGWDFEGRRCEGKSWRQGGFPGTDDPL